MKKELNTLNNQKGIHHLERSKNSLPFLLLFSFCSAFFLLGCSAQNGDPGFLKSSGSTDNASRLAIPDTQANTPKDVALCNQLQDSMITARLMVYYDVYNNYRPDLLRLYIPQIKSEFENPNYQLVFRKWKANPNGETYQDNNPLKFWAERKSDRALVTSFMTVLQWNLLSSEIEKTTKSQNLTMKDTFSKFNFVIDLQDPSASYDVLKISLYQDEQWLQDWNVLIPAFYAHPKTYATSQNSVLAQLHPFYGQENSSFGNEFATQLNNFCF